MNKVIDDNLVLAIANAIRQRTGLITPIAVKDMPEIITGIDPALLPTTANVGDKTSTILTLTLQMSESPETTFKLDDYAYEKNNNIGIVSGTEYCDLSGVGCFKDCLKITTAIISDVSAGIGNYMFLNCTSMTTAVISSDNSKITLIGLYAFYGCTSLGSIIIPKSVTIVADHAFLNCTGLSSLTLPSTLITLGTYAFYGCTSLTTITIPATVTSIGESCFLYDTGITSVTIKGSPSINKNAFQACSALASVDLGSTTSLKYQAFDSTALTEVYIPSTVTSIDQYAFWGCKKLLKAEYDSQSTITYTGNNIFLNCTTLNEVIIPDSIKTISQYTFHGCSSLTSINLTSYVTAINTYAFYLTGLTNITIPSSVTTIGSYAFTASKITKVTFEKDIVDTVIYNYSYIFSNCTNLTTIECKGNIPKYGNSCFYGCTSLTTVPMNSELLELKEYCFYNCTSLTNITIPNTVKILLRNCLGKTGISNITIPSSVQTIYGSVFERSTNVPTLKITFDNTGCIYYLGRMCNGLTIEGSKLNYTGDNALFWFCKSQSTYYQYFPTYDFKNVYINNIIVTNLVIPTSTEEYPLTHLTIGFFINCLNLTSVDISSSIEEILDYAFYNCSALTVVTCRAIAPPALGDKVFEGAALEYIYVPEESIDIYKLSKGWKDYADIIYSI